ncbi:MAG: hypothetical protein A2X36_16715 [Elusimicrobia bacterium GWA2_69_24]|nr:MAG: hypothetical protein A2X36_16715 [Elusimicrobia bacterium GWA2_69_24]HBL16641.1 hypothetical protein [Elusimicrobiota bacterium]
MTKNIVIGALAVLCAAFAWLALNNRAWIGRLPCPGPSSFSRTDQRGNIMRLAREVQAKYGDALHLPPPLKAQPDFPRDFADFKFVRVVVVAPQNHRYSGYHVVMANDIAMKSPPDRLADGSKILKVQFPLVRDPVNNIFPADLESVFIVEKDSRKYPKELEGFAFDIFDFYHKKRLVTTPELQKWCFECHRDRAGKNYLFSPLHGGLRQVDIPAWPSAGFPLLEWNKPRVNELP